MKIFISPIGVTTEHVKGWLAEESRGVQILWLIHSKKGKTDFPKIAKKLKSDLKSAYPRLKIKLKTINLFSSLNFLTLSQIKKGSVKDPFFYLSHSGFLK